MYFFHRKNPVLFLDLKLGETKLAQVNTYKCLGLWLSSDLFWSTHVEYTCLRVRKQLGLILRCFREFNGNCLAHLYKSLVRLILEYCCCTLDPTITYLDTKSVEKIQHFAAKIVTGQWWSHGCDLVADLG